MARARNMAGRMRSSERFVKSAIVSISVLYGLWLWIDNVLRFSSVFHSVQRGIERAFFDLKDAVGGELNPPRESEAVHGSPGQCLQDDEIESSLK